MESSTLASAFLRLHASLCPPFHAAAWVCMYVCMDGWMDGCTCMHAYIHACMYATCMHACIHACMYTHTHTHTHKHVCMHAWMYVRIVVCMCVCMYVRTYVRMYGLSSRTQQNTNRMCSLTVECVLLLAVERKQNVFSYRRIFSLTSSRTQQNTTEHTCNARAQTVSFCLCMSLSLSRAWAQQQNTRKDGCSSPRLPFPSLPFPSLPSVSWTLPAAANALSRTHNPPFVRRGASQASARTWQSVPQ